MLCAFVMLLLSAAATSTLAQTGGQSPAQRPYERTFRQSKTAVEKALKDLQPSMAGRLPVLDGFALPADHPLSRYQRAYFNRTWKSSQLRRAAQLCV